MKLRLLLADDHRIVREGLRAILASEADWHIVAECSDGRETVDEALRLKPDLVVIDLAMPGLNGVEATRQILQVLPATKILVLSMHADPRHVKNMVKAGAHGYLPKDCAGEELVGAVMAVMAGESYYSPSLPFDPGTPGQGDASAYEVLTAREREVLQCFAEGHSTKETADLLGLRSKTVEAHRAHITEKLGLRSVAELTKYAIREGLISLD